MLGIKLCLSDFSDLSAKLSASLRVCARIKQVGNLHTETVNVFCVAHENYPVLFFCADALWHALYPSGSKQRRTASRETILSSVYILGLLQRVTFNRHVSGQPGRQSKLTNTELCWCDFSSYSFNYLVQH